MVGEVQRFHGFFEGPSAPLFCGPEGKSTEPGFGLRGPSGETGGFFSGALAGSRHLLEPGSQGFMDRGAQLSSGTLFPPFFGGCPTKHGLPKKGFPFFPGSLSN